MNKQLEEQNGKPKDNGRREFIKTGVVLASYVFFGRFLEGCGSPSAAEKIIETLSERQQEILQSIVSSLNRIPENPTIAHQQNKFPLVLIPNPIVPPISASA
jgi:hypothetical protein